MNKTVVKGIAAAAAAALIAGCGEVNEENTGEGGREGGNNNNLEVDDEDEPEEDGEGEASENAESNETADAEAGGEAAAEMENAEGESIGTVSFYEEDDMVRVEADIENVDSAGYRGFHLHDEAVCEPEEDFTTAEGHYNPDDSDHGEHPGDMPPLLVNEDGTASLSFTTDRFTIEEMLEDEVSVMIHEDPDNFGHIPDRYVSDESGEPGPDEETHDTGDAGDRYACGIVEQTS